MKSVKYILGLSMALNLPGCNKDPMDKVVDDLVDTCHAVEETNEPCGYRRGSLPEEYGGMCLNSAGMEMADRKLQERTNCRLLVFQRIENGTMDYLIERKNCDLSTTYPNSDLFTHYQKIYPQ